MPDIRICLPALGGAYMPPVACDYDAVSLTLSMPPKSAFFPA